MAYTMPSKVTTTAPRPTMPGAGSGSPTGKKPAGDNSWVKGLITLAIVLAVIGGGIYVIASTTGLSSYFSGRAGLTAKWQAVFLSNNQVYFGQVVRVSRDVVVLRDIYYLQVVTRPLQRSEDAGAVTNDQNEQRLTLIKLGNEIHGPKDEMILNRDHVVLLEDLKDDSQVVKAINDYVGQKK